VLECDIRIWDEIIATLSDTHDKDVFNYLMKFLATLVHGDCTNDTFQIWTGTGANGTGLTKTILTKAFGNYLYEPAQTVFANRAVSRTCLGNQQDSEATRQEAIYDLGVRGREAVHDKLRVGILKQYASHDTIQVRKLYLEVSEFDVQTKYRDYVY